MSAEPVVMTQKAEYLAQRSVAAKKDSRILLDVLNVSRSFGGIRAVKGVSFKLHAGEVVGLIGPNGAGKSTLINIITGVHRADSGKILHGDKAIQQMKPHQIASRGIARTFQIVQPFPQMSVLENVMAGALFAAKAEGLERAREQAFEQLEFTGLAQFAHRPAHELTLANRKRLELAKSLAMRPDILMLDEVNAGLNSAEVDDAIELIRKIAASGITILLVEHLLKVVFSLCERVLVLHFGELIADDVPKAIANDEKVISAYLGAGFAQSVGVTK